MRSPLLQVLEVLRQAEALVEGLGREVVAARGRGVVRLPRGGYPLEAIEREAVVQALEQAGWVQERAGALLGVSGRVIHHKCQVLGIRPPAGAGRRWKE